MVKSLFITFIIAFMGTMLTQITQNISHFSKNQVERNKKNALFEAAISSTRKLMATEMPARPCRPDNLTSRGCPYVYSLSIECDKFQLTTIREYIPNDLWNFSYEDPDEPASFRLEFNLPDARKWEQRHDNGVFTGSGYKAMPKTKVYVQQKGVECMDGIAYALNLRAWTDDSRDSLDVKVILDHEQILPPTADNCSVDGDTYTVEFWGLIPNIPGQDARAYIQAPPHAYEKLESRSLFALQPLIITGQFDAQSMDAGPIIYGAISKYNLGKEGWKSCIAMDPATQEDCDKHCPDSQPNICKLTPVQPKVDEGTCLNFSIYPSQSGTPTIDFDKGIWSKNICIKQRRQIRASIKKDRCECHCDSTWPEVNGKNSCGGTRKGKDAKGNYILKPVSSSNCGSCSGCCYQKTYNGSGGGGYVCGS